MRAEPQQASSLKVNSGSLAQVVPLQPDFMRAYHCNRHSRRRSKSTEVR